MFEETSILQSSDTLPFLEYSKPVQLTPDIFFIEISAAVYIQTPKCRSRNGITKVQKKLFCELMFHPLSNSDFVDFIEKIETTVQDALYQNRDQWFETSLSKQDIETLFTSSLKSKGNGSLALRGNVPSYLGTTCSLTIFDENEQRINPDSINSETDLMAVIKLNGIKCSPEEFMLDFSIQQMMVCSTMPFFQEKWRGASLASESTPKHELQHEPEPEPEPEHELEPEPEPEPEPEHEPEHELELEPELELESINQNITLRNKKEVHLQMFKEAKLKARKMRNKAIEAYAQMMQIKQLLNSDGEDTDSSE